ncbi:MAG TPA: type VI secretion system tube protein Hcp [Thermoguttaceae bacterium]|nr:type VI secretion system tube protein Hcp [Thermoguttaceae bacterium]
MLSLPTLAPPDVTEACIEGPPQAASDPAVDVDTHLTASSPSELARVLQQILPADTLPGSDYAMYLQVRDIHGDSQDAVYRDWIEVESFAFAGWQTPDAHTGTYRQPGVTLESFQFTALSSSASPKLLEEMFRGRELSEATLHLVRPADRVTFLEWEFRDVLISSYHTASVAGMSEPLDAFALVAPEGRMTYTPFDPTTGQPQGRIDAEWRWDGQTEMELVSSPPELVGSAADDYDLYLWIDGIPGESLDVDHSNWIDVDAFHFGGFLDVDSTLGSVSDPPVSLEDFRLVAPLSKASPKLLEGMLRGDVYDDVTLEVVCAGGGQTLARWQLQHCSITSYQTASAEGHGLPLDAFSLSVPSGSMTYYTGDVPPEEITAVWDETMVSELVSSRDELVASESDTYDLFLQVGDIRGDSVDENHHEWIEVGAFHFGGMPVGGGTGGGLPSAPIELEDFQFVVPLSKASPKLFEELLRGRQLPEATLHAVRPGTREQFLQWEFRDVLITSYDVASVAGESVPLEAFCLRAAEGQMTYTQFDPSTGRPQGDVVAGWDARLVEIEPVCSPVELASSTADDYDLYLWIDQIPGECTDANHPGWIDVDRFGFRGSSAFTGVIGGGQYEAAVSLEDFRLVAPLSKASPKLLEGMLRGQLHADVRLEVVRAGGGEKLAKWQLQQCAITSYQTASVEGHTVPVDAFSVNAERGTMTYYDGDSPPQEIIAAWDETMVNEWIPARDELVGSKPDTYEMFLQVGDIRGDSTDRDHREWIEVHAFHFGGVASFGGIIGGGQQSVTLELEDFQFVVPLSKASPQLFEELLRGRQLPEATLHVVRPADRQRFLEWDLRDVLITSYDVASVAGEPVPLEAVCLRAREAQMSYTEFDPSGQSQGDIVGGWDERTVTIEPVCSPVELVGSTADDYEMYLRIDEIPGESGDANHRGWIDVDWFQFGAVADIEAGTGLPSDPAVTLKDFRFAAPLSKASPKLLEGLLRGPHFDNVTLEIVKPGDGQKLVEWQFAWSSIRRYENASVEGLPLPIDTVSLNVPAGSMVYTPIDPQTGEPGDEITINWVISTISAGVLDRHVFYNNSAFDEHDPAAGAADDGAIASGKRALFPGEAAGSANYTSFSRGINGIMVDIAGLPAVEGPISAADYFELKVGNDADPDGPGWSNAPEPAGVSVRPGEGVLGSDRVTIIWDDHAIENRWLQVTVLANEQTTGLAEPDVFYFGNAVAESGNSDADARVTTIDLLLARNNPRSFLDPAPIDFPYDYNRDGRVNATDVLLARNNQTDFLSALELIDLSTPQPAPAAAPLPSTEQQNEYSLDLFWLTEFDPLAPTGRHAQEPRPTEQTLHNLIHNS